MKSIVKVIGLVVGLVGYSATTLGIVIGVLVYVGALNYTNGSIIHIAFMGMVLSMVILFLYDVVIVMGERFNVGQGEEKGRLKRPGVGGVVLLTLLTVYLYKFDMAYNDLYFAVWVNNSGNLYELEYIERDAVLTDSLSKHVGKSYIIQMVNPDDVAYDLLKTGDIHYRIYRQSYENMTFKQLESEDYGR